MTLEWARVKQVMIVCEPSLEKRIVSMLESCGAKLSTIFAVGGMGLLGRGAADVSGGLIRIECYCSAAAADSIATIVQQKFFSKYDVFLTVQEVSVLRPDKF